MVVSDLIAMTSRDEHVAPHNGAFAKVLGRYVREESILDLGSALAKMTLLPARRLEQIAPAFRRKGRLQVGADADITMFDPATVRETSEMKAGKFGSAPIGIPYVMVSGKLVIDGGQADTGIRPGQPIRYPLITDGEIVLEYDDAKYQWDAGRR